MTLVVLAAVIIMSFYFEISIKKSVIFALLYQGLSIIVDYIAYISNNTINPIKGFMNSPSLKYRHLYNRGK